MIKIKIRVLGKIIKIPNQAANARHSVLDWKLFVYPLNLTSIVPYIFVLITFKFASDVLPHIPGQGYPLPGHVNDKLVSILPFLSNLEVGVVCHALHQTHIYLETEHVAVSLSSHTCYMFPAS